MRRWQNLSAEENAFFQNTDMAHRQDADAYIKRRDKKKFRNPGKAKKKSRQDKENSSGRTAPSRSWASGHTQHSCSKKTKIPQKKKRRVYLPTNRERRNTSLGSWGCSRGNILKQRLALILMINQLRQNGWAIWTHSLLFKDLSLKWWVCVKTHICTEEGKADDIRLEFRLEKCAWKSKKTPKQPHIAA